MGGGGCHRGHSGVKARGPITIPTGGGGKQRQGRWRGPLATRRGSRARFESAAHGLALPTMIFSTGVVPLVHTRSLTKDPSNFP